MVIIGNIPYFQTNPFSNLCNKFFLVLPHARGGQESTFHGVSRDSCSCPLQNVVARFKIEWEEPFLNVLRVLELLAFDLKIISIDCISPLNSTIEFSARLCAARRNTLFCRVFQMDMGQYPLDHLRGMNIPFDQLFWC